MLCSTVQQLNIFGLEKNKYSTAPGKALLFVSSIYSKTSSNNALTKDSYSESFIHKGSTGKTLSFFLKANNSLSFSIRVLSLFHTSIISAPLILLYCNSVSIFFLIVFRFYQTDLQNMGLLHYGFTFNVQESLIFSSFRKLPLFRKVLQKGYQLHECFAD